MTVNKPKPKLSTRLEHGALLEARGELSLAEVADKIGLSKPYFYKTRAESEEYKIRVAHHRKEIERRHYDASAELQKRFDEEAPAAFETVASLHKRADRDTTRLGAAKEILDRSSIAPAKRDFSSRDEGGTVIQIGIKKLEQIFSALDDVGDQETIDLLEGEYKETE